MHHSMLVLAHCRAGAHGSWRNMARGPPVLRIGFSLSPPRATAALPAVAGETCGYGFDDAVHMSASCCTVSDQTVQNRPSLSYRSQLPMTTPLVRGRDSSPLRGEKPTRTRTHSGVRACAGGHHSQFCFFLFFPEKAMQSRELSRMQCLLAAAFHPRLQHRLRLFSIDSCSRGRVRRTPSADTTHRHTCEQQISL